MSSVFVVTVPSGRGGDLYLMRDYVRESLELGVLIVDEGVRWELLELPELGEVRAQGGPTVDASPAPPETVAQTGGISFSGHGAREKKADLAGPPDLPGPQWPGFPGAAGRAGGAGADGGSPPGCAAGGQAAYGYLAGYWEGPGPAGNWAQWGRKG